MLVLFAAGFIAGSIPMNGTLYFNLNSLIALVVAVLQATTIILLFLFNKSSFFAFGYTIFSQLIMHTKLVMGNRKVEGSLQDSLTIALRPVRIE